MFFGCLIFYQVTSSQVDRVDTDIIDAEFIELDGQGVIETNSALSDLKQSRFINADQTAYSKFSKITSYDKNKMFMQDIEEYNNPYTSEKISRYKRSLLA